MVLMVREMPPGCSLFQDYLSTVEFSNCLYGFFGLAAGPLGEGCADLDSRCIVFDVEPVTALNLIRLFELYDPRRALLDRQQ
jgi:hypothetical protein